MPATRRPEEGVRVKLSDVRVEGRTLSASVSHQAYIFYNHESACIIFSSLSVEEEKWYRGAHVSTLKLDAVDEGHETVMPIDASTWMRVTTQAQHTIADTSTIVME